jgi:FdhE protein
VRQGGAPPTGKWIGNATDGVKAPEPILQPDPATRFSVTAERLAALAPGHAMADWLAFMARLSWAQHEAAMTSAPPAPPAAVDLARASKLRRPPLAPDVHRRDPQWRDALVVLLAAVDDPAVPEPARAEARRLRQADAEAVEGLANRFLEGAVSGEEAGAALYLAAALQVHYTRAAAALPGSVLHLLPVRGECPCCGSSPVAGVITATGPTPGVRYLYCSLCSTAWNHVRAVCITCEDTRDLSLKAIEGGSGAVVAETCGACRTYAKMLYQAKDTNADPYADDLASLGLDLVLSNDGWFRHAPNPLLLIG